MRIYCMGEKPTRQASFTMSVAPAATIPGQECPAAWVEQSGDRIVPVQFNVEFKYGVAEVDDELGNYLVAHGLAKKTRLIMPREADPDTDPLALGY